MSLSLKYFRGCLILITIIVITLTTSVARASDKGYDYLINLSSEELYDKGNNLIKENPDRAMLYFSLIEGRYYPKMSLEEAMLCIEALIKKWRISLYVYYDYPEGYKCLSRAQEIARDKGLILPTINLQLGILYQIIGEQTKDHGALQEAFEHYREGLREAIAINDTVNIDVLASNFVQQAYYLGRLDSISNDWEKYLAKGKSHSDFDYNYNKKLYEGLMLIQNDDYERSMMLFDSLYKELPSNPKAIRCKLNVIFNKAIILIKKGEWKKAAELLMEPLRLTESLHIKDGQIETYEMLSKCYEGLNNKFAAMEYENKSLKLKDSLVNYSQLSRLEEVKSGYKFRKYQERIANIELQKKWQKLITLIISFSLIVVCGLLIVSFNRNRKLKQANRVLYDKNIDILRQSEKEIETRREYERRLEEMTVRDIEKEQSSLLEKIIPEEKYKGSRLDESDKEALVNVLLKVMESTNEYLQPDFSLERLAELANSKSKLVSQVINEKQGRNFNSFINEFRIREACRRINDIDRYGRLTLDAISKSVGFRARSSFFAAFKSVTGLTPSEFQKIARSAHKA